MTPAAGQPPRRSSWSVRLAGLGLLAVLASLMWLDPPWHRRVRLAWFDACQRIAPRRARSLPAVVVAIDEKSLRELGQWPWPRTVLARLIDVIAGQHPAAIALDLLMPEPDRLAPVRLAELLPAAEEQTRRRLLELPDSDVVLAAALSRAPTVLGFAGTAQPTGYALRAPPFRLTGREPKPGVRRFGGALGSLEELDRAAQGHGLLSSDVEGGVVRRMPLVARVGEVLVPGLALEMLRVAAGAPLIGLSVDGAVVNGASVGDRLVPTDPDGAVWVHFSPGDGRRYLSASDVLAGRLASERLKGKLVLIGATGLGLVDYQTVATGERLPGAEVHAQLLEVIFDGATLRRPLWSRAAELLALLAAGCLLVWAVPSLPPRGAIASGLAVVLLVAGGSFALFLRARLLVDAATPAASLLLLFGALLAGTLLEAARRQQSLERDLQRQREEAARMAGELDAARRVQLGMLPRAEALRAEPRLELAAAMAPAREVGGDLYDFFPLGADRVFFLIGDVAGKGLPASLFMAVSKALYKSSVIRACSPGASAAEIGAIMTAANREVSRENTEQLFVTVFAGVLDLRTGELAYCNAGHEDPYLLRPTGGLRARLAGGDGPPLCVDEDFAYRGAACRLEPGESLFLVTDGVTEARNAAGELYGAARLRQVLNRPGAREAAAGELLAAVRDDVAGFTGPVEAADDLTLLVLRWLGAAPA